MTDEALRRVETSRKPLLELGDGGTLPVGGGDPKLVCGSSVVIAVAAAATSGTIDAIKKSVSWPPPMFDK